MRKPRDIDSELKALADKAKQLKQRRVSDLGALVMATEADALDAEVLTGALLDAATNKDKATEEAWRKRGAAFFQGKSRGSQSKARQQPETTLAPDSETAST